MVNTDIIINSAAVKMLTLYHHRQQNRQFYSQVLTTFQISGVSGVPEE